MIGVPQSPVAPRVGVRGAMEGQSRSPTIQAPFSPSFASLLFLDLVLVIVVPADPSRRSIVQVLGRGERSVGELARLVGIKRPRASRHVRKLLHAGFLTVRRQGSRNVYALRTERLSELRDWMAEYRANLNRHLDHIEAILPAKGGFP